MSVAALQNLPMLITRTETEPSPTLVCCLRWRPSHLVQPYLTPSNQRIRITYLGFPRSWTLI